MELSWNGKDITEYVNITGCVHRDFSSGKSDCLELTLDHASTWYRWGPEEDDEIIFTHNGYSTGKLYLNTVMPVGDKFRVLATSIKRAAARKAWATYRNTTLQGIFDTCSAECGMSGKLFGLDGSFPYQYVIRENEGCAAFLDRIGKWEGATVKAFNGSMRGVSVLYAQNRTADQALTIRADQEGVIYRRRDNTKYSSLTINTPYAKATARDSTVKGNNAPIITYLPALDDVQAGRWARGLLLMHNRQAEKIEIETELNIAMTALARVDIKSDTDMLGSWLVDEAEHDFFNRRSSIKMLRVIDTIQ